MEGSITEVRSFDLLALPPDTLWLLGPPRLHGRRSPGLGRHRNCTRG